VDDKATGNVDRKAVGNADPVAVSAAAFLEILSSWPLTRTVMANCRPVKSQTRRRPSRHLTKMATGTSHVMRCGPLIAAEGLAVPTVVVRLRVSHVRLKKMFAHQRARKRFRERMPWGELPAYLPREIRKLKAYATMRRRLLRWKDLH
jgi:hypothetical protein